MQFRNTNDRDGHSLYLIQGERFSCWLGSYPSFCGGDILSNFNYPLSYRNKTEEQWTRDVFCSLYEHWDMDLYWDDKEEQDIDITDSTFGVFVVERSGRLFYNADKYLYLPKGHVIGPHVNANSENLWKMMFIPMHFSLYSKWAKDRGPINTNLPNTTPPREEAFDALF